MPRFKVTGPDGTTYNVDAPEGATQAQVLSFAQRQHRPETKAAPTTADTIRGALADTIEGALPNWSDEIAGAGAWLKAKVGLSNQTPEAAYEMARRGSKQDVANYQAAYPAAHVATRGTGVGLGLALPAGKAKGAGMVAKMAHGAAVGAGYGAAAGAGEGDSISDRVANAEHGGTIGALFGAAATPVVQGANLAGRWARLNVPGVDYVANKLAAIPNAVLRRPPPSVTRAADRHADRVLAKALNEGHIQTGMGTTGAKATPDAILAEQQRRAAMGVPAMPGDITQPMGRVTSWASRGMGPGQRRVVAALDKRKAEEAGRVRQHVIDEFGPVGDPIQQMEQHVQAAKDAAAPAYKQAYNQPMVVTPEIESVMKTPAFREALPQAVKNIRNAKGDPVSLGFRLDKQGNITGVNTLTTEGFDQVVRAMKDSGRAAAEISPTTGKVINNTNSVHINARAQELRDHIANQNEPYRQAVEGYGDDMAVRDAFEAGKGVRDLTGHEINAQVRSTPDAAHGAWAAGARTSLADDASRFGADNPTGDTARHVQKALGDDNKQDAIGTMTGNTGAVRGLQDRLEAEHQGNLLWREVQGNSRTADRQALDADLDATVGARPSSSLSPRGMLMGVLDHIASKASPEFKNQVKARIGQLATETNPATVQDLMADVAKRAQADREFADLLHRSGLVATKAYAANVVPVAGE